MTGFGGIGVWLGFFLLLFLVWFGVLLRVTWAQLFSLREEHILEVNQNKLTTRQSLTAGTLSQ